MRHNNKGMDLKQVMRWLHQVLKCPVCNHKYQMQNTKIIDSQEDSAYSEADILIHSDCSKCKSSVMFNIEVRGPEIFSVGMVTDLTSYDSNRFWTKSSISSDELIQIHSDLKKFNGDFVAAFAKK